MPSKIILASSSPFRKQLLDKFHIAFETCSPDIDESPKDNETPAEMVLRLSIEKAKASTQFYKSGWAIGSDQIALFNGKILGKPHTKENAIAQLTAFSAQQVTFLTGLALYDIDNQRLTHTVETFTVHFRALSAKQIEHYINVEQPLNCAGSFKSEGLGIALFEKLEGEDPNTLIGLPLIALNRLLLAWDFDLLS